jgi:hypothetical protein
VYCANCGKQLWTDEPWSRGELFFCSEECARAVKREQMSDQIRWMIIGDIVGGDGPGG